MTAARPRRTQLFLVTAVVVLLGAGAVGLAVTWPRGGATRAAGSAASADPPPGPVVPITGCPAAWGGDAGAAAPWVPVTTSVPGTAARLVPPTAPSAALVCGYTGPTTALTAHTALAGDLAPVAAALTDLPRKVGDPACALYLAATDDDDYLIGLTYPDGTLWVGAPHNHCTGASNGAFTTTTNVGSYAAGWLAAGRFAAPGGSDRSASVTACPDAGGRLGQDVALVPDTPVAATVCVSDGVSADRVVSVPADRVSDLVATFDALPTVPSTSSCRGAPAGDLFTVVFRYATGPGVRVSVVPGCDPPVDNGSLQATTAGDVLPLLTELTR